MPGMRKKQSLKRCRPTHWGVMGSGGGGRGSIQGLLPPVLHFKMDIAAVASQRRPRICAQLHFYCLFSNCKERRGRA